MFVQKSEPKKFAEIVIWRRLAKHFYFPVECYFRDGRDSHMPI